MGEAGDRPTKVSLAAFFGLLFAISVPFWLLSAVADRLPSWFPDNLPVSALQVFNPLIVAAFLVWRADGSAGLGRLLKRVVDVGRFPNRTWYLPVVFLFPVVILPLSIAAMRLLRLPFPEPQFALATVPVLAVTYFIVAIGEELGWTGYALDPMQDRWGVLIAAVLLGAVGAAWHVVPFIQGGNSASWIAGQCLFTVASRVIIVWLYNNAGRSVFAAVVLHTTSNVSWNLFPNKGSHYDPVVTGIITAVVAIVLVVGWGSRTLARGRVCRSYRECPEWSAAEQRARRSTRPSVQKGLVHDSGQVLHFIQEDSPGEIG